MRLEVGKIVGAHGLKGDLKFQHWCDDFSSFSVVKRVFDGSGKGYAITSMQPHKNVVLMRLEDMDGNVVDSIDKAEALRGTVLWVEREELGELPEGTYYLQDLLGIEGVSEDGKTSIGVMKDWIEAGGGAGKVYVFRDGEGRETLVPSNPVFVKNIDLKKNRMTVNLIEGLVGLNAGKPAHVSGRQIGVSGKKRPRGKRGDASA